MGVINFLKHVRKGNFRQAFMGNRGKWSSSGKRRLHKNNTTKSAKRTMIGKLKNWIGLGLFGPRLKNGKNGRTMLGKTKNYFESALRKHFTRLGTRKSRNDRNNAVQTAPPAPPALPPGSLLPPPPPATPPVRIYPELPPSPEERRPLRVSHTNPNTPPNNGYGRTWGAFSRVTQPENVEAARAAAAAQSKRHRRNLPNILEPNRSPGRSSVLKFVNSLPLLGRVTKSFFPSPKPSKTLMQHKRSTKLGAKSSTAKSPSKPPSTLTLGAKSSTAKSPSKQNVKFPNDRESAQQLQIATLQRSLLPLIESLKELESDVVENGLETNFPLFNRMGHAISINYILENVNTLERQLREALGAENSANFKTGVARINKTLQVLNTIFETPSARELTGLGLSLGFKFLTIGPIVSEFMKRGDVKEFVRLSDKLIN
jgi:hypothetical protein